MENAAARTQCSRQMSDRHSWIEDVIQRTAVENEIETSFELLRKFGIAEIEYNACSFIRTLVQTAIFCIRKERKKSTICDVILVHPGARRGISFYIGDNYIGGHTKFRIDDRKRLSRTQLDGLLTYNKKFTGDRPVAMLAKE